VGARAAGGPGPGLRPGGAARRAGQGSRGSIDWSGGACASGSTSATPRPAQTTPVRLGRRWPKSRAPLEPPGAWLHAGSGPRIAGPPRMMRPRRGGCCSRCSSRAPSPPDRRPGECARLLLHEVRVLRLRRVVPRAAPYLTPRVPYHGLDDDDDTALPRRRRPLGVF
jgi:hypothetical protein